MTALLVAAAIMFAETQISFPKLRVALALAGVLLTDQELRTLQRGFRSDKSGDMVRAVRPCSIMNWDRSLGSIYFAV